jgi:hypothetical protein
MMSVMKTFMKAFMTQENPKKSAVSVDALIRRLII